MSFVILIGASGSGKTTIARAIAERHAGNVDVFHFDRIGIPSAQEMARECGSIEEWQRARTIEWMARLAPLSGSGRALLFEGQTRLSCLADGAKAAGGLAYRPILVDCDDNTRLRRLVHEREQPDLANETMMNWARYLRRSAIQTGCEILDTSTLSLEQAVAHVLGRLNINPVSESFS